MVSSSSTQKLTHRQQQIFDFLAGNGIGVLASVGPDCEPHATVIYYAIEPADFIISFLTKTGTRKHDNLVRNNQVELVVFDSLTQTVAQVYGVAEEIADTAIVDQVAAKVYRTSTAMGHGGIPPIAKLEAGAFTAFAIKPVQIRIAYYQQPTTGDYEHIFESLESFDLRPET